MVKRLLSLLIGGKQSKPRVRGTGGRFARKILYKEGGKVVAYFWAEPRNIKTINGRG